VGDVTPASTSAIGTGTVIQPVPVIDKPWLVKGKGIKARASGFWRRLLGSEDGDPT
jgi:hypothetical protein